MTGSHFLFSFSGLSPDINEGAETISLGPVVGLGVSVGVFICLLCICFCLDCVCLKKKKRQRHPPATDVTQLQKISMPLTIDQSDLCNTTNTHPTLLSSLTHPTLKISHTLLLLLQICLWASPHCRLLITHNYREHGTMCYGIFPHMH